MSLYQLVDEQDWGLIRAQVSSLEPSRHFRRGLQSWRRFHHEGFASEVWRQERNMTKSPQLQCIQANATTGTKSIHCLALETRADGLHKLRLAGRWKERLLVFDLLNLLAASLVPLPAFYHKAVTRLALSTGAVSLASALQTRPDIFTMTSM